jgi:two-component system sensor histidine kinase CpxA
MGLGLAIAFRAIQLHNGTISASNANPGLMVEIDLPGARA